MADVFRATYHNTKNVLGRKCLQVILEVPLEQAGEVYDILGYPTPHESKWVAVALLKDDASAT